MKNFWKTFGSSIAFLVALAIFVLFLSSCGGSDGYISDSGTDLRVEIVEVRSNYGNVICAVSNGGIDCDW